MAVVAGFIGGMFSFGAGAAFAAGSAAFGGWLAGAAFGATILGSLAAKLLTTVAVSALSSALTAEPPQGGGITITSTIRGEQNPETIILGKYATAGQAICAPYSHGRSDRFLTQVIELCSAPGATLERVMIGDTWVELSTELHPFFGHPVAGEYNGLVWVKYYDGTQTEADPYMLDRYGDHPDRPWSSDMVGAGICYVIMTFGWDKEDQTSVPTCRFELGGIPLYDPRKDSSVGGEGAHRIADPTTWEQTENAAVIAWNVMRGIPLPGGEVWGGNISNLTELPWAVWTAAMNRCDAEITHADGTTEPAYRAGLEVALDQPPAAALEEIFKVCSATIADLGYGWGIVVGAPALPVYSFTDDDIIVSKSQELDPFPGIEETYNAVTARYPDPDHFYETKEAPRRTNANLEALDAFGRRTANLALPAAPYALQVQRLMDAWIKDERRFRRHVITLPPDAAHVELIDTVDWSSIKNGYVGKDFSVYEILEDPRTGIRQFSIRERDPDDYNWRPDFELPSAPAPSVPTPPMPDAVSGFQARAITITDAAGVARRPAIALSWASDILAEGLRWEIRLTGQASVTLRGTTQDMSAGGIPVSEGILPATAYEVRARLIANRRTVWTAWELVTTDSVRLGRDDIAEEILDTLDSVGGIVDRVNLDLAALSEEVDQRVQTARNDLGEDISAVELQLTQGLAAVPGQINTGIQTYDVTVQGQFASMAGEIASLAASLSSDALIVDGSFAEASPAWTYASAVRVGREGSADALVLASPEPWMAQLGIGSIGSVSQTTTTFAADQSGDVLRVKFWAASTTSARPVTVGAVWRDSAGAEIAPAGAVSLTVSGADTWHSYTAQMAPPVGAVTADLTITKTTGGTRVLMTGIEVRVVNTAIEARVSSLEAAVADTDQALATFQTQALVRFDGADASMSSEAAARASADGALSDRIDTVTATAGANAAAISGQQTAIANAGEAITQIDQRMTATFGRRQIVRDPEFDSLLAFWSGALGSVADLTAKDAQSEFAALNQMPARRAFSIPSGAAGSRATPWYDCAPGDIFAISAHFFQQAGAPSGLFWVQFRDAAGANLTQAYGVRSVQYYTWHVQARRDVVAPEGAVSVRALMSVGDDGTGSNRVYIANGSVERLLGFDFMASAEFTEVRQAQADADTAFTAYVSASSSRFNGIDGTLASHASSLSNRYTKAEADSAMASATSAVTARTNRASASGLLRVTSVAAGDTALTRIGLMAEASANSTNSSAGLYLDAISNGVSQVSVVASRFAVVTGGGANAPRMAPFYVDGSTVYMDNAVIRDASFTAAKIGPNALYIPYLFSAADRSIGTGDTSTNQTLVLDRTIPDFEGGGYLVAFNAYFDGTGGSDSFGMARLVIDGVEVARTKFGIRTSGANSQGMFPVTLIGSASGTGTSRIRVYAWNASWNSDTSPNSPYVLRNIKLTVSGTRR